MHIKRITDCCDGARNSFLKDKNQSKRRTLLRLTNIYFTKGISYIFQESLKLLYIGNFMFKEGENAPNKCLKKLETQM